MFAEIEIDGSTALALFLLLLVAAPILGNWLGSLTFVGFQAGDKDKGQMTFWRHYCLTWRDMFVPSAVVGAICYAILLGLCLYRANTWLHILKVTGLFVGASAMMLSVAFLLATLTIVFGGAKRGWPWSKE